MAEETKDSQYLSYPMFKGLQKPNTGTLHHMGGYSRRRSHPRLHHCVLHLWFCGWLDSPRCFPLGRCSSHFLQTEEGTAHQEGRPWSVHLCLLNEDVTSLNSNLNK